MRDPVQATPPVAWHIARARLAEGGPGGTSRLGPAVDVHVRGTRIAAVVAHDPAATARARVDARGALALPGLVNGHTHSHELLHRGRQEKLPLELWMNHVRPPGGGPLLTPDEVYARTAAVALEALRSGATTVVDDVGLQADREAEQLAAIVSAYEDVGVRAFVAPTLMDRPFAAAVPWAQEELPQAILDAPAPAGERVLALAAALARARRPGVDRVCGALAPSAPQRCTPGFLRTALETARDAGVPALTHVHETRAQAVLAQQRYGRTMIAELDADGLLSPALSLVHGVWLRPDDLARIAAAGATLQHNPTSNLRLGSGLAPLPAVRRAGVPISLGGDGCGSCVSSGMLDAVRMTSLLHGLHGDDHDAWITVGEAYEMGSGGGARALGLGDDLGAIAPGRLADLCLHTLDGAGFAPLNDPLAQLVHAAARRAPSLVVVDGRVVVAGGRVRTVDERALLARVRDLRDRHAAALDRSDREVTALRPAYQRILARAERQTLPPDTIPARLAVG